MRAGRLDRRLTLQTRTLAAANSYGEKVETFSTLATVWGGRRDLTGREFFAAGQQHAEANARFEIRFRDDLTTIHRVVCNSITYDIVHIAEIGRGEGLELICKTVPR